jgi:hypothetical protein
MCESFVIMVLLSAQDKIIYLYSFLGRLYQDQLIPL